MGFSDKIKIEIKTKSNFTCCWCWKHSFVEVHHIIPIEEGGSDMIENAAPLCPTCHTLYGDNKKLRKTIKLRRDLLFEQNSPIKLKAELIREKQEKERLKNSYQEIPFLKFNIFLKKLFKPDNKEIEIIKAKIYYQKKKFDEAEKILLKLIEDQKEDSQVYFILGVIAKEKNDVKNMIEYFDKSVWFDNEFGKDIDIYKFNSWIENFNAGANYYKKSLKSKSRDTSRRLIEKSIKAYEDAIICNPDEVKTYENLVFVKLKLEYYEDVIEIIKTIIEMKNDPQTFALLSDVYFLIGNRIEQNESLSKEWYSKGLDVLEKGFQQYPENIDLLSTLTNTYIALNQSSEARRKLESAVNSYPNNKYFNFSYSSLLIDLNEPQKAIIHLEKVLKLDPAFTKALYYKGIATFNIGAEIINREECNDGQQAIEKENDVKKNIADLKFKEALQIFQKYQELEVENGENVWYPMWKIYTQLGMLQEAENAKVQAEIFAQKVS